METGIRRLPHGGHSREAGWGTARSGTAIVILLAIAHLANDMVSSTVAALLPTIRDRFVLSEGSLALIVGLFSISSAVSQPFLGGVIDRVGHRTFVVWGLVVSVGLLGLIAVAPSVWMVAGLLVVGGLGSAAFHPAGAGAARAAGRQGDLAVGLFTGGGMLGLALGPALLLLLLSTVGMSALPWMMIPGLLLAALLYRATSSLPRPAQTPVATVFDARLLMGSVGELTIIGALLHLSFGTFSSAIPLWLVSHHGAEAADSLIGWTLSIFFLAAGVGGVVAGHLGRQIDRGRIVTGSLLLAPVPLLGVLLADPGTAGYYILVAISGALVNAGFPLLIVSAQQSAPRSESTATGMVMGMSVGLAGVAYAIVGQFQGVLGIDVTMGAVFLTLLPAAVLARHLFRRIETGGQSIREPHTDADCLCAPSA